MLSVLHELVRCALGDEVAAEGSAASACTSEEEQVASSAGVPPHTPPPSAFAANSVEQLEVKAIAAEALAHFDLPLIFDLLVDAARPQVAAHALKLFAAGVRLLPLERLEQMVPLFGMAGEHALLRELHSSDASLLALQRALSFLLPLLIVRGLALRPLLRGWVRLVLQSPPSRWLVLLNAVVNTRLGGGAKQARFTLPFFPYVTPHSSYIPQKFFWQCEQLHCVLSLLLYAHIGAAGGGAEDNADGAEDLVKLAHTLCGNALPETQLRVCMLLAAAVPVEGGGTGEAPATTRSIAVATASSPISPLTRALTICQARFVSTQLEKVTSSPSPPKPPPSTPSSSPTPLSHISAPQFPSPPPPPPLPPQDALFQKATTCADPSALQHAAQGLFGVLVAATEHSHARLRWSGAKPSAAELAMWSAVNHATHEALEALNLLLPGGFLGPITSLLGHQEPALQSSAVCLLSSQLAQRPHALRDAVASAQLDQIVRHLCGLLLPNTLAPKSQESCPPHFPHMSHPIFPE